MGDSISEGVVESFVKSKIHFYLNKLVEVGTAVKEDEIIARIETDKVTVDILAQYSGVITKYHAAEGDTVTVGAQFVDIDSDAKAGAATP